MIRLKQPASQITRSAAMKWSGTKNWGLLALGIWLIATGATRFVHISAVDMGLILALLAIGAGVLILMGR
jgi:hypothetical protein